VYIKEFRFLNFNLTHLTIKHIEKNRPSVAEKEKNSVAKSPDSLTHSV
jgi:hypothetical protein